MRNVILGVFIAVLFSGCIAFPPNGELSTMAQEEWERSGPADEISSLNVEGHYCIGTPAYYVDYSTHTVRVYVPYGLTLMARPIMRYELSKAAWHMNAIMKAHPCVAFFAGLDSTFHLPTSELHSWYRVLFPGELKEENE